MITQRNVVLFLIALIILFAVLFRYCRGTSTTACYHFPNHNLKNNAPAGTTDSFELSQDYPQSLVTETVPWAAIDFHTNPTGYAQSILTYCLEGNSSIDFKVQNNTVRKWYHVPWLHFGIHGREWRHGMTSERSSQPLELHPNQTSVAFTWAVGFYNSAGGYTIGKVWPDCGQNIPNPRACVFPEGTATFKLLFTSASNAQVPYMQNSFTWTASTGATDSTRSDHTMRLLQIDIAVKDQRSPTGWVFGTYVYDGFASGTTPWDRLKLVGLIWGNDPAVRSRMNDAGVFINPDLHETWINPAMIPTPGGPVVNDARSYHLGLGGRLNGPVDNLISSCISCHGKAAVLKDTAPDPIENIGRNPRMTPSSTPNPGAMTVPKFTDFFGTNIPGNSNDITYNCFVSGLNNPCSGVNPSHVFINLDYSLQVAIAIENYYTSLNQRAAEYIIQQNEAKNGQ